MKTPIFLPLKYQHNKKEKPTMDFASTQYARDFFQGQVPTIIRTLKQIAANQETQIELQQKALRAMETPQRVFVCREENSTALYNDAGNINHLFVTANLGEAISWAQTALCIAKKSEFHPFSPEDERDFYAKIADFKGSSVWVYKDKKEDARENYGICVDVFDLTQNSQQLRQLFE
ncbi:MAG: hypothetical protein E7616_10280 [Ruminococcaceae bacterium]|nr:hypothetical protein [Oscillospiraceae bacterium]